MELISDMSGGFEKRFTEDLPASGLKQLYNVFLAVASLNRRADEEYCKKKYAKENKLNKYGNGLLLLPVPKLVVFYNGTMDQSDENILRLSDSFPKGTDSDIEVKVRMLNVNMGRNKDLLNACKPLGEYAWLVEEVRRNNTTKDEEGMSSAIDKAISSMPKDYLIKPFLEAHRAEVKGMLLTEYNEAEQMELFKEDGRREGRAEGRAEGIIETLVSLVRKGLLSMKDAADQAGMTETAFRQKMIS